MFRIACRASLLVAVAFVLNVLAIGQDEETNLYDLHVATPEGTATWFVESTTSNHPEATYQVNRTFGITIKQVDAKGIRIVEIHVARIDGWIRMRSDDRIAFDSNDLDAPGAGEAGDREAGSLRQWMSHMMAATGQRYLVRIDANGKLSGSVEGVAHEMQGKDPQVKVWIWELANLAETAFGRTPNKPTSIGGTWKFTQPGTDLMHVARQATVTLSKVTDSAFEMALTGTVEKGKIPPGRKDEDPNSYEAQLAKSHKTMEISNGKLTGKLTLSRQDGMISEAESKVTFNIVPGGHKQSIKMIMMTKLSRTAKPGTKPQKQERPEATLAERTAKTRINAKLLATAVRMYYTTNGKLPESLAVLAEKDRWGRSEIEELPKDGWGHPYKLVKGDTPRQFQVTSAGPDKKHGTADDISSRTKRR